MSECGAPAHHIRDKSIRTHLAVLKSKLFNFEMNELTMSFDNNIITPFSFDFILFVFNVRFQKIPLPSTFMLYSNINMQIWTM